MLTHRRNPKAKFLDLENAIRHSLKSFGLRLGKVGCGAFEQAVRRGVADDPLSTELVDAMASARAALWRQYCRLHEARTEPCRRFAAILDVGPVTALFPIPLC